MLLKIDKGIPLPPRKTHPLGYMDVGDSFFLTDARMHTVSNSFGNHKTKKFCKRTVTENGVKGVRVWRIE